MFVLFAVVNLGLIRLNIVLDVIGGLALVTIAPVICLFMIGLFWSGVFIKFVEVFVDLIQKGRRRGVEELLGGLLENSF